MPAGRALVKARAMHPPWCIHICRRSAPGLRRQDSEATFTWGCIQRDPAKLLASAKLVAVMDAQHQGGVYR